MQSAQGTHSFIWCLYLLWLTAQTIFISNMQVCLQMRTFQSVSAFIFTCYSTIGSFLVVLYSLLWFLLSTFTSRAVNRLVPLALIILICGNFWTTNLLYVVVWWEGSYNKIVILPNSHYLLLMRCTARQPPNFQPHQKCNDSLDNLTSPTNPILIFIIIHHLWTFLSPIMVSYKKDSYLSHCKSHCKSLSYHKVT